MAQNAGTFATSLISFMMISLGAAYFGKILSRVKIPVITAYLLFGILAGPYVLELLEVDNVKNISAFINDLALATIAFVAGSELYFPHFKGLFSVIGIQLIFIVVLNMGIVTAAVYLISPYVSFLNSYGSACIVQISLLCASLMMERSPAAALAIVNETHAKGPVTRSMLGITVFSDSILLLLFSITSGFAISQCSSSQGDSGENFISLGASVASWVTGGCILSAILMLILWAPKFQLYAKGVLVFSVGYGVFLSSRYIKSSSEENLGCAISIEPLLICVIAGTVAGNYSKNRRDFANILHHTAPYIFIPFFTLAGAGIDLSKMVSGLGFAAVLVFSRIIALFLATFLAGKFIIKQSSIQNLCMWMTLIPQGGTLIGLVQEISAYGSWTQGLVSSIFATIVMNHIIGVILLKFSLWKLGECHTPPPPQLGASEERIGSGPVRVMGVNPVALAIGVKLFEFGHDVEMVSCTWLPSEKTRSIWENTRLALIRNHSEAHALDSLEFRLASKLLDQELLRNAYHSCPQWNYEKQCENVVAVDDFGSDDAEEDDMALKLVRNKSEQDDYISRLKELFDELVPKNCVAVIFAYPDDEVNLMCCRMLSLFRGDQDEVKEENSYSSYTSSPRSYITSQKVVAVVNDANYAEKLSEIGVIPVYTLSSISELVSRIALTATMVVLKPEDVVDMIHPLESKTMCKMNIEEHVGVPIKVSSKSRPYPRNYHSGESFSNLSRAPSVDFQGSPFKPQLVRNMSYSQALQENIGMMLARESSFHPFNELSNLSSLGLVSPHVRKADPEVPMGLDILESTMTGLSPVGLRRSGTM